MQKKDKFKKGFTLVELIVSIAVFTVVVTISLGSILSIFESNRKTRSTRAALSNLNFIVESISKEMRYGKYYFCGNGAHLIQRVGDCVGGGDKVTFLSTNETDDGEGIDDEYITYRFQGGVIEKNVHVHTGIAQEINEPFITVTSPDVVIDDLKFYVIGSVVGDNLQPKIIIKIKVHVGQGGSRTDLTLQTMVSQRVRGD